MDIQTYNTSEFTYTRANFDYSEKTITIENGNFNIKLNSYEIKLNSETIYTTSINDSDKNFSHNDMIYSFWDYYENIYLKKIKQKEIETKDLSFCKKVTFNNVKTKVDVDKYIKINNEFYEINDNKINYNGINYGVDEETKLVNIQRQIPIKYESINKNPYCLYDIDSYLKHKMNIYNPYTSQNNIRTLIIKNAFSLNHQENIIIETENNSQKFYGHYLIDFKVDRNNQQISINKHNGYQYVDLALPSGTLWAAQAIMSEDGEVLYFAWGETTGYSESTINKTESSELVKKFNYEGYKWRYDENTVNPNMYSKYYYHNNSDYDKKRKLDLDDDAAHVHMGDGWHMPTIEQINELINSTTITTDDYEKFVLTSNKNGQTITFMKYGYVHYNNNQNEIVKNVSWMNYDYHGCELYDISTSPSENYTSSACLRCNYQGKFLSFESRTIGLPIYGVIG